MAGVTAPVLIILIEWLCPSIVTCPACSTYHHCPQRAGAAVTALARPRCAGAAVTALARACRVVHGLFGEFAEAASVADTVPAAAAVLASPDRRPGGHLLSDQRRHSACAAFGGEPRVPSPAFSPPQDPSGWQGRNLLSPADGECWMRHYTGGFEKGTAGEHGTALKFVWA